jgi:hypothetical protein
LETHEISEDIEMYNEFCLNRAEPARSGIHKIIGKLRNFLNKFIFGPTGQLKPVPVWI